MSHTIQVMDHDVAFNGEAGRTVLDSAIAAGYELPYSCRTGICGSCRCRLVSGEVQGDTGAGLSEQERREGHVLLCQAKPRSDLMIAVREIKPIDRSAIKTVMARVYRKLQAAEDVTVLQLRFPAGTRVKFKAGQYLSIRLADGSLRHFSMANPPHQNDGVELHIRQVPGGRFSQEVVGALAEGDFLELSMPFGEFYLREEHDKPIVLLASGTGFAPIKSIVEDAVRRKLARPMVLYWGARRAEDLYRIELPRKWEAQLPWFSFVPVLSEPGSAEQWQGRTGFVHQAAMDDIPTLAHFEVYACGAPGMISAARQDFVYERGLDRDAFYCDAFVSTAEIGLNAEPAATSEST
ncbi:flavin oxidoreductase [Advenella kashmirensis W13003]|uniref:Flavin oxidoreductase n=1 Tax=Advenella kashmirensis W13003 TaxID=1424334 RepID=V8QPJ6_9BURK|nr:CDP-6-deoxy-delta-3,4-glucoseen reductase [Advenella kashmirensis]ETF01537.1 flavin oxidoreductase [Advenella kashmirensis W13003]